MWQVAGPLTGKAFWIVWTSSDWQSSPSERRIPRTKMRYSESAISCVRNTCQEKPMLRILSSILLVAAGTSLWAEELPPDADTPQISLEVRFASVPTSTWQRVGLKTNTLVPPQASESSVKLDRAEIEPGKQAIQLVSAVAVTESRPPVSYQIMGPEMTYRLIEAAQGDRRTNISFAPKVTVFSARPHRFFPRPSDRSSWNRRKNQKMASSGST